jgi:DNA helicase-2/ATP-dependent DNA helicase PcrA
MGRLETYSKVALRIAKQAGMLYSWMHDLAARIPELSVRGIVEEVVAHSGFEAYLGTLEDATFRKQNLAEMLSAASAFDAEKSGGGLPEFLERVALVSDSEQIDSSGGRAALMTLHTSKGLEYPIVFMAGMEEGLFPHSRSADIDEEIEEERRLCYVGMTRARQLLYLTNTLSREIYGVRQESRQSRFMREVDPSLIRRIAPERHTTPVRPISPREAYVDYGDSQLPDDEPGPGGNGFSIGAKVVHPTFGRGIVRRREGRGDGAKAWVNFERGGIKLLVLKFANLRLIAD